MTDADRTMTREQLLTDVLGILEERVQEIDSDFHGDLTEDTLILGDLDFESVSIVEFCMSIGKHFKKKLPFQNLVFREGKFQDFSVGEMVTFLEEHLLA